MHSFIHQNYIEVYSLLETNKIESLFSFLLLNYEFLEVINLLHFNSVKQIFMSACSRPSILLAYKTRAFVKGQCLLGGTGKGEYVKHRDD